MVARALAAPAASAGETGMTSLQATMGVFQVNRGFSTDATSGGVWLTRQDKIALRGARCSGRAGNVPTSKW
ncbi:hypothetical protein A3O05_16335 [Mycobacteroides abscessus]|nr:hypothetical protein A3O05_16335 [Mycobacteroides abscessus]